jgi:hypothetical protein
MYILYIFVLSFSISSSAYSPKFPEFRPASKPANVSTTYDAISADQDVPIKDAQNKSLETNQKREAWCTVDKQRKFN